VPAPGKGRPGCRVRVGGDNARSEFRGEGDRLAGSAVQGRVPYEAVNIRAKIAPCLACGLLLAAVELDAFAQFNPRGRRRPPATAPTGRAAPRRPAPAKPADKPQGPSTEALIARYTAVVLAQPGAQFPLQRLAELYRERDGKLDQLIADFVQRAGASGPEHHNALIALAGIYLQDGQPERAIATYQQAITEQPPSPVARMALARLLSDQGDKQGALEQLEHALAHITEPAEKEQALRTALQLALDLGQWDKAKQHHRQLVQRAQGSFYVRAELGRELLLRQEYERAVAEFRDLARAAAGDNRVLAPALRDLGRALAKLGKTDEALDTLRHALHVAGAQAGIRREVYLIIVDAYRSDDRLRELIAELEQQPGGDFERLRLLGSLYEETGQLNKALSAYQKALQRNGRDIETRLKVVQLLQIQGELGQAIQEYEALIRAAPRNPDFVFQLAEALIQRGDRQRALEQLRRLEARSTGDEETLSALVDFYERVDETERARALLQRLAQTGSGDPRHLVELGDRYWQEGDKDKALRTWQRIKAVVPDRVSALLTLGEVYVEHNMPQEGLLALREALKLKPQLGKVQKAYALALERTGASAGSQAARTRQYDEARHIWEKLLRQAADNPHAAREARQHIVTLYSLSGGLRQRVAPLQRRFTRQPPDLEAGRLLGEVQIRMRDYAAAERTLRRMVKLAPGDVPSLTRLERVLVLQRKLREAIEVLERLVRAEPKRAREYYQRMAQYAAERYQDDEAVKYAARAVELSPDDADGHRKLGEMYRRRQAHAKAISAFRQAIAKNDRLFPVYFELAELLLSQGKVDEADKLLRRVVRASPDEELVAQAARLSMQVNLGRGTLESLEKELLPVALGNPQRPLYRRLLVEIYGALAFPLVHQAQSGDAEEAVAARNALRQIGERAVKPLLDALGDERSAQQRIAIELLSHIQNRSAGPALFAYATGPADPALRARAMVAVGALQDPGLLPKLGDLLAPHGVARAEESDPISVAAAWAVARMNSPKARGLLLKLLQSDAPTIRGFGALGLGLLGDHSSVAQLARVAGSVQAGPIPRAAAAFALGQLGAKDQVQVLLQLAEAADPALRAAAIVALARLRADAAPRAVAEALVSPDATLRTAAVAAALVLTTGEYRTGRDALTVPQGRLDARGVVGRLQPAGYSPQEHARALIELVPALTRACATAVQSSPERARTVADALLARDGAPAFGPLTRQLDEVEPQLKQETEKAAESLAAAVVPAFVALARHPSAGVRSRAVGLLATRAEPAARTTVLDSLSDPDERVQASALAAVAKSRAPGSVEAVARLLGANGPWPIRVRAAETLGVLAAGSGDAGAVQALSAAVRTDEYALVREAAIKALVAVDRRAARPVLERAADNDSEPRVRLTARSLLGGVP
jgi:tetratricopeptide (TPR) repeat protein